MGRPKARYNEQGQKECLCCKVFKDIHQFRRATRHWDGLSTACKRCCAIRWANTPHKSLYKPLRN